jgi:hypothetical protein
MLLVFAVTLAVGSGIVYVASRAMVLARWKARSSSFATN